MKTVNLIKAAWYGDVPYSICFPDEWDVRVVGNLDIPSLGRDEIHAALDEPIGAPPLSEIVTRRRTVGIIVDDLTRPTPAELLVSVILNQLVNAGIAPEAVTVFIAGGTHSPASKEEIATKLGKLPPGVQICAHDSRSDLTFLGKSRRGTPIHVNRRVMECDLRIGVGCIYPHPAAAFSGGCKILIPGLAGFDTVRYLHDHVRGADKRADRLDNEFRLEIEEISDRIGLHFVVNAALNPNRGIAAIFAGDCREAFRRGVEKMKELYSVAIDRDADVVVADMYPFDTSLQFAYDRGMWPLMGLKPGVAKIVLAACPEGVGGHSLFPVENALQARLIRRLKHFRLRDVTSLGYRLRTAIKLVTDKPRDVWMLSEQIPEREFQSLFPKGKCYREWDSLLSDLRTRRQKPPVRVVVYRCAPFLIPI